MTPPELLLWARLRARHPDKPTFRRQHPVGPYILDFYCAKAKLAVEVDGQSHGMGDRHDRDEARDEYPRRAGIRVVRFLASDVMADPNGIAQSIVEAAQDAPSVIGSTAR
jgi:very-short-patch-repair endonuclease